MAKVVLDARAGVLVGELSERCRTSGVRLVLASDGGHLRGPEVLSDGQDAQKSVMRGSFAPKQLCIAKKGQAFAIEIAHHLNPGDVIVTNSLRVANEALSKGATAFHCAGWMYDERFVRNLVQKPRTLPERIKHEVLALMLKACSPTGKTTSILFAGIGAVIPQFAVCARAETICDARLFIDADNTFPECSLAAARAFDVPVVVVHDTTKTIDKHLLLSDPMMEPASGGFWINDIQVPTRKNSADDKIVEMVGKGDVVLTGDVALTIRCLRKGAVVVDRFGARYYPQDITEGYGAVRDFKALRKRRLVRKRRKCRGSRKKYAVVNALEMAFRDTEHKRTHKPAHMRTKAPAHMRTEVDAHARSKAAANATPGQILGNNRPFKLVPGMARTLAEAQ